MYLYLELCLRRICIEGGFLTSTGTASVVLLTARPLLMRVEREAPC